MNVLKEVPALQEMRFHDSNNIEQAYLYKLSKYEGLNWFKNVYFMASEQDKYAPFRSASI